MRKLMWIFNRLGKAILFLALSMSYLVASAQLPDQRFKRVDYDYDLISGKVNDIKYQEDAPDQFYHKYDYDANNRIIHAKTSCNKVLWDMDAKYFYYSHGPLARTEIGDSKVQGIDNVYTLHGWIKGVNSNVLDPKNDVGKDALQLAGNDNSDFAKDAFGYSLGYYDTDFTPIANLDWATVSNRFVAETPVASNLIQVRNDLYNGNISSMVTTIVPSTKYKPRPQGTSYKYDQLNRIIEMQAYQNVDVAANSWQSGATYQGSYNNLFSYDASGNILKQLRLDFSGGVIDSLTYRYEREAATNDLKRNRLLSVKDNVGSGNFSDDIDDQATINYSYDALGNLQSDVQEEIDTIKWSVYGKIKSIIRKVGSAKNNLRFDYDASGNRIAKHVYTSNWNWLYSEYYARDTQGNVLSVYRNELNKDKETISFAQTEKHIYGSTLLGIENTKTELLGKVLDEFTNNSIYIKRYLSHKNYQGNNHLGNVLAVVTDRKIPVSSNGTNIDYYLPDILSANDYYPFGAPMAGRTFSSPSYRYGFNGQEKDDEINGSGNSINYLSRVYNPRLGRFLSVDPLTKKFAMLTPYQFGSNSPITHIDLDGEEGLWYIYAKAGVYGPTVAKIVNGTEDGVKASVTNTWNFISKDAWKLETWKQTGLFIEEVALSSSPYSGIYNPSTPKLDAMAKSIQDNIINGDAYTRSKAFSQLATDIATAYVSSKGFSSMASFATRSVITPFSKVVQSISPRAIAAASSVESGATLYRIGTKGISETGSKAQFWALENPLVDPEAFAKKYNIPVDNIKNADFVETATLKKGSTFVTRIVGEAPGSVNKGNGIEAVIEQGGTTNNVITPIKKQ